MLLFGLVEKSIMKIVIKLKLNKLPFKTVWPFFRRRDARPILRDLILNMSTIVYSIISEKKIHAKREQKKYDLMCKNNILFKPISLSTIQIS